LFSAKGQIAQTYFFFVNVPIKENLSELKSKELAKIYVISIVPHYVWFNAKLKILCC